MDREEVFYVITALLFLLCLVLLWSNFKLMKAILDVPVKDRICSIEEAYAEGGQELYCKDFVIRKWKDGTLVVRKVK